MAWYRALTDLFKERPLLCDSLECRKPIEGKVSYWTEADRVYHPNEKCEVDGAVEEILRELKGIKITLETISVKELRERRKYMFP